MKKVPERLGYNEKRVIEILLNFRKNQTKIKPAKVNISGFKGFSHLITLSEIARKFLVPAEKDHNRTFDLVMDEYRQPNQLENFVTYREALEEEEKNNFQNLALMLEKRLERKKTPYYE